MSNSAKVLFVYPNVSGTRRIPIGISILSSCLKEAGHTVDIFDTTFYLQVDTADDIRVKLGIFKKVDMTEVYKRVERGDPKEDFIEKVKSFRPDIIAISIVQDNYLFVKKLLKEAKNYSNAFIVAGGVMPTLVPEKALRGLNVDAVIVGEGEIALVALAKNIINGESPYATPNLCYLSKDMFMQNQMVPLSTLTELPFHDYSIFDKEHLWRPYDGKRWKMGYVELTRGCSFNCSFCANKQFNELYEDQRRIRSRDIDQFVLEVKNLKKQYGLQFFSFNDENFLSFRKLKEFSKSWKTFIALPFLIQTRIETIRPEKLNILKEAGCISISIGIECGDEEFRRTVLNRNYSNEMAINAFKWCSEAGIRTTANNMIGFPREREAHIRKTIELNRKCKPDSVKIAYFAPYLGTVLHKVCLNEGLIDSEVPDMGALVLHLCLNYSPEHKEMLKYYFENFQNLVFSEENICRQKELYVRENHGNI